MGELNIFDLNTLIDKFNCKIYLETGTGIGVCLSHALKYNLQKYYSIDLDDKLIVLFSASELLARQMSPDAQLKMQQAQAHYNRIKGRLSKTPPVVFGAIEPEGYQPRGPVLIARTS